jgi:two-component system invasion response regulator UvrY
MKKTDIKIKIVLADDNKGFLEACTAAINSEPGLEVVANTTDAEQVVDLVSRVNPDLLILDIHFPGASGISLAREISKLVNPPRILAFSQYQDVDHVRGMLDAGATGFVSKGSDIDMLIAAIRAVHRGERVIPDNSFQF